MTDETLPEGTDRIIAGAEPENDGDDSVENGLITEGDASAEAKEKPTTLKDRATDAASGLRDQATEKARDYAVQGRDRAVEALDGLSRFVGDAAGQVDSSLGSQYGDYARKAAEAVAGAADGLRGREVEDLLEDARGLVRRSPAVAIGAAAAAGFLLARIIKSGSDALGEVAKAVDKPEGGKGKKSA